MKRSIARIKNIFKNVIVQAAKVTESLHSRCSVCIKFPSFWGEFHVEFHIKKGLLEDILVWVHEFTESTLTDWFFLNGIECTNDVPITIAGIGIKLTSIPHILASLHTLCYVESIRFTPEEFAQRLSFIKLVREEIVSQ